MTATPSYTPGLAASGEDSFTQNNTAIISLPQRPTRYGFSADDIAANSLVGRVTITGELKLSAFAASDGSQNPIGVTTHAVSANDSNSNVDSNSAVSVNAGNRVGYHVDGTFNYALLNVGAGWTADLLNANLEANGQGFSVDVIQTATPDQSDIES